MHGAAACQPLPAALVGFVQVAFVEDDDGCDVGGFGGDEGAAE